MSTLFELSQSEVKRYSRQITLPGFGLEAQAKLKRARVLVVGVGGLGCPVLLYLAAAGVGTLGIIDGGDVHEVDLQRQILFSASSVGKRKVSEARERIWDLNPLINIESYPFRLMAENAEGIIKNYDLVIDGSGNLATRYLVNDACVVLDKPFVAASIARFEGLLGVYNGLWGGIRGPTYRCLFPEPRAAAEFQRSAGSGVLGAAAGVIGSLQAIEALKMVSGLANPLYGELLRIDLLSLQLERMYFRRDERIAQATQVLHDGEYAVQCGGVVSSTVHEMSVKELHQKLEKGENVHLIDVREPFERDICSIGGTLIPMAQIESRLGQIPRDGTVVIYCRSGGRSRRAIEELQRVHGFTNLVNLRGGILAWSDEIDPELPKY